MSSGPTVAVTSTRAVVEAAARRAVDVDPLLARYGVERAFLGDPRARLPAETALGIWRDAARASGEPELHVWAAVELPWGAYRVIDALAAAAATAGEALQLISTYFRIVHDTVRVPVEPRPDGGGTMRIQRVDGGPIPAPYVDYTLCACIYRLSYAGAVLHPEVHLRRPAPLDLAAHRAALGPKLHFGATEDRLDLDDAEWSIPMRQADPVLRSVLEEHATQRVRELPDPEPNPLDEVIAALCDTMPRGRTEAEHVGARLGVSKRTLQRRLASEGLTWSDLVARTRLRLAERLLPDPHLTVDEVAVLLGYSEASTFHRAFRRWTGVTPGEWRAHHPGAQGAAPVPS